MTSHPRRLLSRGALLLLLGALAIVLPMTAAQAVPSPSFTISAAPNPVGRTDTSTITVTVDPGLTGETVTLENKVLGLIWTQVDSTTLDSEGKAQFLVSQGALGNYQYRAKVSANANHTAGTSSTLVLQVVADGVPDTQPGIFDCDSTLPSIARPDGGDWQCMYNDEFSGTALDTTYWHVAQMGYQPTPKTEPACMGNQSTGNVWVSGDQLHLKATVLATAAACPGHPSQTSRKFAGEIWHNAADGSGPTLEQTYGYYEVRAKLPDAHGTTEGRAVAPPATPNYPTDTTLGLQETFYLWPSTDRYGFWPNSGEMDFAEFYSGAGNVDNPAMHQSSGTDHGGWAHPDCNIDPSTGGVPGGFNTYKFLWTPTHLTTWVNDDPNPCTDTVIDGHPFDKGFYLVLAQAFGTSTTLNAYTLTPGAKDVGTTDIDYVRVWQ
jgi:hypothetical protein